MGKCLLRASIAQVEGKGGVLAVMDATREVHSLIGFAFRKSRDLFPDLAP